MDRCCCRYICRSKRNARSNISMRCKLILSILTFTFGYVIYFIYSKNIDIFNKDNLFLLSHPEKWEWGADVNKDLTVQEAIGASLYALKLWARLCLPWLAFGLRFLIEFSKENPSFPYIILILIFISFVFFSLQRMARQHRIYERVEEKYDNVQYKYTRFIDSIKKKSMLLAKLTPHISFFLAVICLAYFFPIFAFETLNDSFLIFMIGIALPIARCIYLLNYTTLSSDTNNNDESLSSSTTTTTTTKAKNKEEGGKEYKKNDGRKKMKKQIKLLISWLKYWTIFSLFLFFRRIPVINYYIISTQISQYLVLMFILWMLLPATDGADMALKMLIPFVNKNIKKIPKNDRIKDANFIWRMLVTFNIISDEKRKIIDSIIKDSGSIVLISLLFLFTPGFITYYGCLMVGYLYPIYASMYSVSIEQKNMCLWWLTYMIVFNIVFLILDMVEPMLGWIPIWPENHLRLLLFIWLQLPYFRGAQVIYSNFIMLFELKNETNNEILDMMSPHNRGAITNNNKQEKHKPRDLFDVSGDGEEQIKKNGGGEEKTIRKRKGEKVKNKQKKELNIYAEKKEEEESINDDNKKNK